MTLPLSIYSGGCRWFGFSVIHYYQNSFLNIQEVAVGFSAIPDQIDNRNSFLNIQEIDMSPLPFSITENRLRVLGYAMKSIRKFDSSLFYHSNIKTQNQK